MGTDTDTLLGDLIPLSALRPGDRACIHEIRAGRELIRRLLSLGLRVGVSVEVLQRRGRGVVVGRAGNRIALGAGVADKLWMAPVRQGS